MNPGRELDLLIAKYIFNKQTNSSTGEELVLVDLGLIKEYRPALYYSTEIAAAWKVVERIVISDNLEFHLTTAKRDEMTQYMCLLKLTKKPGFIQATEDTAPHAICLAALKAKGIPL